MLKNKRLLWLILPILLLAFTLTGSATDYTFTQQSGTGYFVNASDKSDALEDENELRTIVNDLGTLLGHTKMDGTYPADGETGGTLGIFGNYYLKTEIDALSELETIWVKDVTDSTELATALNSYYLKTAIDSLSEVETIYSADIVDTTELATYCETTQDYLKTSENSDSDDDISNDSIGSLSDVDLTDIADLKILKYNSTSGNWECESESGGGGASQLSDLSDVGVTTKTDKCVLVADGDSFESRALTESDISDLGAYITDLSGFDTDDLNEGSSNKYFPGFTDLSTDYGFTDNSSNWNTAYGWGDWGTSFIPNSGSLTLSGDNAITLTTTDTTELTLPTSGTLATTADVFGYPVAWSGLGMNINQTQQSYYDTLLANGIDEVRIDIPSWENTAYIAGSKDAVIAAVAKGLKVTWGLTSDETVLTTSNWDDYCDAVETAAAWAQANGVYEFQIGNEEIDHIDDITMIYSDLIVAMKALATDVQAIFTNGNVSYSCTYLGIGVWVAAGRGDIDIIASNVYSPNVGWQDDIDDLVEGFGAEHTYLTEFNYLNAETEEEQAEGITEMLEYIKDSGMTRATFFYWKDYAGGYYGVLTTEDVYRQVWNSLIGSELGQHDSVTIGTAAGLSLDGQELSMATADTDTQGTLTAADWDTFNNKVSTEVDPNVDSDAKIKAILVDEVTKTGDFTAGRITKINNASGIVDMATNTDAEVASAVSLKHTQNTDVTLIFTNALASDHTYSGEVDSQPVGENVVFGEILYYDYTLVEWMKAQADDFATAKGTRIALETKGDGQTCLMLVKGYIRDDSAFDFGAARVFLNDDTAGTCDDTAPAESGDQIFVVGEAKSADILFFDPGKDVGEI